MAREEFNESLKSALYGGEGFTMSAGTQTYASGVELEARDGLRIGVQGHEVTVKKPVPTEEFRWQKMRQDGVHGFYISDPASIPDVRIDEGDVSFSARYLFLSQVLNDPVYGDCFKGAGDPFSFPGSAIIAYQDGCWRLILDDEASDSFSESDSYSGIRSWPLFDDTIGAAASGSSDVDIAGLYPAMQDDDVYYGFYVWNQGYGQKLAGVSTNISGTLDGAAFSQNVNFNMMEPSVLAQERVWTGQITWYGEQKLAILRYEDGSWLLEIDGYGVFLSRESYPHYSPWSVVNENGWIGPNAETFTVEKI